MDNNIIDKLEYDYVRDYLKTKYIGRKIVYLDTVSSTNDYIKRMASDGENEGLIVIAECQSAGRGRMGRSWNTHKGESIAMSILLRPDIAPQLAPSITPILAVSAVEAIRRETGLAAGIKWPNDIVLERKKLCGILTEMNTGMEKVNYIVAGIGININQDSFENEIKDIAVSMKMVSGTKYDRRQLLAALLNTFEEHYDLFKKEGINPFIEVLKRYSVIIGRQITVDDRSVKITGTAVDIDNEGALLVQKSSGEIIRILSGEVTVEGFYKI